MFQVAEAPTTSLTISHSPSPCPRVSSAFSGLYYGCSAHVEFNSGQELCCLWHCLKIVLICLNTVSVQLKANRDLQAKITFKGLWKMPATLSLFQSLSILLISQIGRAVFLKSSSSSWESFPQLVPEAIRLLILATFSVGQSSSAGRLVGRSCL